MSAFRPRGAGRALLAAIFLLLLQLLPPASGAFINFDNCLDPGIINSEPRQLQFTPYFFDAKFRAQPPHNLTVTVYGNVSGQQVEGPYPDPDDPDWKDDSIRFGKIVDVGSANSYSTLLSSFNVLTWSAWDARPSRFCESVVNGSCPLVPLFDKNASDPQELHAFQIEHDFGSPYSFSTLAGTLRVVSGGTGGADVVCVSAEITPDLGPRVRGLVQWLPAVILILKALATIAAAIWSPWGSSDIFRWSSNYGRDEDLLRLVTPGFGDCLQYIQFATLMGSLSLQFPGFFQPALAETTWSLLLFNQSFVSHGKGTQSLEDGVYVVNGTYGITQMRQLIGMTSSDDVWACMAIWFLVISFAVVGLCQVGFGVRWFYQSAMHITEEDLRHKNVPFTVGNLVRLLLNYFILPVVAISLFQLVISPDSPGAVVGMAAMLLLITMIVLIWIFRVIFHTKPRTFLFDDMVTVLLYGPLYNTYSDSAAPFALVPVIITFMRGVAFGAVQPSGIAQVVILAICEVILILTLNGFRPFQSQTSMNLYHTFFAIVRLITVLLCVAFVPTMGVSEVGKGWVGYIVLLLHAAVLVFGFFMNAAQTLIEVVARSLGVAGHNAQTGAVRGSILNWRMLKKRKGRPVGDRASMASDAVMLAMAADAPSAGAPSAGSRSMSASSQQLLNRARATSSLHRLSGLENSSNSGDPPASQETDAPHERGMSPTAGVTAHGKLSGVGIRAEEQYYRAPRKRANTADVLNPGAKSRSEDASDVPYQDSPTTYANEGAAYDVPSVRKDSPAPAYFRPRQDSTENVPRTDYAVREVDQYYRGPALSHQPTRKLKTGPADPQGPAASAQSWFQRLVSGMQNKKKDSSKGFEVVRSSKAPPDMQRELVVGDALEMQNSPPMNQEPYRDSPPSHPHGLMDGHTSPFADHSPAEPQPFPAHFMDHATVDTAYHGAAASTWAAGASERRLRSASNAARARHAPTSSSGSVHPGIRAEQRSMGRSVDLGPGGRRRPSRSATRTPHDPANESEPLTRSSDADRPASPPGLADRSAAAPASPRLDLPAFGPVAGVGALDRPSTLSSPDQSPGGAAGDDSWLRDVDRLEWSHQTAGPGRGGRRSESRDHHDFSGFG